MIYFSNKLSCWFLIFIFIGCCSSIQSGYDDNCQPQLADSCFRNLSISLSCHDSVACDDSEKFCELLDDSLQCSADIIDGDCSATNEIKRFDSWYKGLRAVYSYMCDPKNFAGSQATGYPDFRNSKCWSKKEFVECVSEMLNVHHVIDLLKYPYGYNGCIRMMIAMASCNTNSQTTLCYDGPHSESINHLLFLFFSQHKCEDLEKQTSSAKFWLSTNYSLFISIATVMLLNCLK